MSDSEKLAQFDEVSMSCDGPILSMATDNNSISIPQACNINSISSLMNSKWDDDYLRLLAISDHLTECAEKYKAYKMDALNKDFSKAELRHELDKELTDLLILLEMERMKKGNELYRQRIVRFRQKLCNEKGEQL